MLNLINQENQEYQENQENLVSSEEMLDIIAEYGLSTETQASGSYTEGLELLETLPSTHKRYKGRIEDTDVYFLSPELFLKTIQQTEKTLNIQLSTAV